MKSRATVLGHPVHPMLIPFPIAFLTGAVAFDVIGWVSGQPSWWSTGGHLAIAGVVTGAIAGIAGFIDYVFTVPPNSSAKVRATKHMAVNLTAIGLFAASWLIRSSTAPSITVLAIEVLAMGMMGMGGYLGGTLVTRNLISVDHRFARAGKWKETTVHTSAGDSSVAVAASDELEVDQMKLVHLDGKRIVLARTEEGYVAFEDRCTHKGGSLAGGVMIAGVVQCLWHGSQFDVKTGRMRCGPATTGIRTYAVDLQNGKVMLATTASSSSSAPASTFSRS